ncbi:MAG: response regulator [Anaerolineales bacterium]|nr:response regulator [Anaerolineales bacterium]
MHTVLIIEDTIELAEVIQATLERMGIAAFHEPRGEKGLNTYMTLHPDLVMLDIALPDIKGWKILEQIRAYTEDQQIPMPKIVVISAFGDPANRLMGKLQDIARYLIKPFTTDQIEREVGYALGLRDDAPPPLPDLDDDGSIDPTIQEVMLLIDLENKKHGDQPDN